MYNEKDILDQGESLPENWSDMRLEERLDYYENLEEGKRPIDKNLIEVASGPVGELILYFQDNGKKIKIGRNTLNKEKDGIFHPVRSTHKPALCINENTENWQIILNDSEQEIYAQELSQELMEHFSECKNCTVERSE